MWNTQLLTRPLSAVATLCLCLFAIISCSTENSPSSSNTSPPPSTDPGTTVEVSVNATDTDNDTLHYRWAATQGTIANIDAPTTSWVVPNGSGLQFVYVLVSDNKGGYTEHRAAVLTTDEVPTRTSAVVPASTPTGGAGYLWGALFYKGSFTRNIYLPKVTIRISGPGISLGVNDTVTTDMKGEFFFSGLTENQNYALFYTIPGFSEAPFIGNPFSVSRAVGTLPTSPRSYIKQAVTLPSGTLAVAGSARLADKAFCGIRNEFFTDLNTKNPNALKGEISATAELLTTNNGSLGPAFPVNHYGDYLIVRPGLSGATDAKVRVSCEQGNAKDSGTLSQIQTGDKPATKVVLTNSRPVVASMSVILNGQDIGRPDLPKPRTLFPKSSNDPFTFPDQDLIAEIAYKPGDDAFLSYKGLDSRKSACAYYRAIRAVEQCDGNGYPQGAQLTLAEWRKRFNLSPFPNGNPNNRPDPNTQEIRVLYINRADLNFGRDMQAIRLQDGSIAYNTCNYAGPQNTTGLGEPVDIGTAQQPNIDLALDNARRGIGMVACVAMDYSAIDGINGGQPFTKFYSFGPDGKLLLSVSLDGRREKFMPGSCTACHGGDFYGGHFPVDGSGQPDVGSRFQPFDIANLDFHSSQKNNGNPNPQVETAIRLLNRMMVPTEKYVDNCDDNTIRCGGSGLPAVANATVDIAAATKKRVKELIDGWYDSGTQDIQDITFLPSAYTSQAGRYQDVVRPMCQTCHAAQKLDESFLSDLICGGSATLADNHVMTNALVPFERFWQNSKFPSSLSLGCNQMPKTHPKILD